MVRREGKGKTIIAVFANKNLQTIYQADRTCSKAHQRQWARDQVLIQLLELIHLWTDNCIFKLHIYLCLQALCSQVLNPSKERDPTTYLDLCVTIWPTSWWKTIHSTIRCIICVYIHNTCYIWNCNSLIIFWKAC